MPEEQSVLDWIEALVELVRATGARLLLPGDDVTVQALMQIVHEPLPALRPGVQAELGALIRSSLGDPAGYLDSIHKGRLAAARPDAWPAGAAGRERRRRRRRGAGRRRDLGYPVIVRPTFGWASRGVRDVRERRRRARGDGRSAAACHVGSAPARSVRWCSA